MKASDIMTTNVLTIRENESVSKARTILMEEDITALPVVNEYGDLSGIITQTDFFQLEALVASKILRDLDVVESLKVHDVMIKNTITLPEDATLAEISSSMVDNSIHRVIITRDSKVVGLITAMDVLKTVVLSVS